MASVTLQNVTKIYRGRRGEEIPAVLDLSLEVPDKSFVVLLGPSGCGKTSTLRMVAGLESLTSGRILIGDTDVSKLPPGDRDVTMVFQNYSLYPHLSVAENLAFGLRVRHLPADDIARRVHEGPPFSESRTSSPGCHGISPEDSSNVSPWDGPLSANPGSSSSTNPSPTSTPKCARNSAQS